MKVEVTSFEQYTHSFSKEVQSILNQVRAIVLEKAPEAAESISYGMPAYKTYGKPLVYFAAFKNHLGLYATPSGHKEFAKELSNYKQGKGSVQFQFDEPIPFALIEKIIDFRVKENQQKYQTKK
jgi:uncharacterized protein YdhG (YjbR/CyaY superfamily)